ncbi:MAG: hydrogenase [Chloroflexota bacterium]
MPALDLVNAARLVNLIGALILLTAFAMLVTRQVFGAVNAYALQSVFLAAIGVVVGYATHLPDLYLVALITLVSKAIIITYFVRRIARQTEAWRELSLYLNIPASLLGGCILVVVAYFVTFAIPVEGSLATKPSLAIAVAVMLIGLFVMVTRAELVMQIVGLLTLENGLFFGALAISYGTPLIVEFGIFFDILVAVLVLLVLVTRIRAKMGSTSTTDLTRLRG